MPFDEVGRLAGTVGQEEQGDAHVQDVAGKIILPATCSPSIMATAELARRILGLPDLELAMLRAHAAAPVAGPARAELLRRHPQLKPMTNESLKAAVEALCEEDGEYDDDGDKMADFRQSPKAEAKYGPVGLWDVSEVTCMAYLFCECVNFNEDISAWDLRWVKNLRGVFAFAPSFNQPLAAWDVRQVTHFGHMVCSLPLQPHQPSRRTLHAEPPASVFSSSAPRPSISRSEPGRSAWA